MAIPIPETWDDYVYDSLLSQDPAHQNPEAPAFLSTGAVGLVSQNFPARGKKWKVPGLKDLSTMLGGDQRIRKGVDMTLKSSDGWEFDGTILHRGDAFEDEYIDQAQTNLQLLSVYGPQIAAYNEEQITETVKAAVRGAFAPGGALEGTHSYGDGTAALDTDLIIDASSEVAGKRGVNYKLLYVNSRAYAAMKKAGSVTLFNATPTGANIISTGTLPLLDGRRVIIDDEMCTGFTYDITVVAGTDLITTTHDGTAADHGFEAGDIVRFEITSSGSSDALPAGISAGTDYYVIASGLTGDDFRVSTTSGGSTIDITDAGTGTFQVVSRSKYHAYASMPVSTYLGYQKSLALETGRLPLKGGGTDYIKWTVSYGAGVYGVSYDDSALASDEQTEGPDRSSLLLASTWSKVWANDRIRIMQIKHAV